MEKALKLFEIIWYVILCIAMAAIWKFIQGGIILIIGYGLFGSPS